MVYEFNGHKPVIHESAFIHPQANVTGNVVIGRKVYIGPGAAVRGDWGEIIIEDGCNVQENCTIHMFPGVTIKLQENAHIGHGAVIHGATIGANTLVGINAVVLDNAIVGRECIIGALCLITSDTIIPDRSLVVGNPGRIVKQVSDEMLNWKIEGTAFYHQLPEDCRNTLRVCEPLREIHRNKPSQSSSYKTWKQTREQ